MRGNFLQLSRHFSFSRANLASLSEPLNITSNTVNAKNIENCKLWKKLFLFGAVPASVLSLINAAVDEEHERPEFVKYPHLRIRNKPYPWRDGVKTLFHNPYYNALPDGYEDELH